MINFDRDQLLVDIIQNLATLDITLVDTEHTTPRSTSRQSASAPLT